MSNAYAIAAVSATLRNLLHKGLHNEIPAISVSLMPPDKARTEDNSQINLFLYQTEISPDWRNMNIPGQYRSGETACPPLALNLYYLMTVYGENNEDVKAHHVMGKAMRILHDHAILRATDITDATPNKFEANGVQDQTERVRITNQPMSLDEMSKLWNTFQTQYRLSVVYKVSVVLIDGEHPALSPLPVLKRGSSDRGARVLAGMTPRISSVVPPYRLPGIWLGQELTIAGTNLDDEHIEKVRFSNPRLKDIDPERKGGGSGISRRFSNPRLKDIDPDLKYFELSPLPGRTSTQIRVRVNDKEPDTGKSYKWVPGLYTVSLVVRHPDLPEWTSNEIPLAILPQITNITPRQLSENKPKLLIHCHPQPIDTQRVLLLFGDRQILPEKGSGSKGLVFLIANIDRSRKPQDGYPVRIRIDGVDSIPIDPDRLPEFEIDPKQRVKIDE